MRRIFLLLLACLFFYVSCAKDRPYLAGHIRRAHDAIMTTCDPYNLGALHTCVVFSSAFRESLYIYDATASEMVLSPMSFFPLKVQVGPATDHLVRVVSDNQKFPFMLALDPSESAFFAVRLFPSSNGSEESFSTPIKQDVSRAPFKMAALELDDCVAAILTYPQVSRIEFVAINKMTGEVDRTIATVGMSLGTKPSHVEIDASKKTAVISDEGENNVHIVDLTNISDVLKKGAKATVYQLPVSMNTDRLDLSRRDFGFGLELYALVFKASGNEIKLLNIDRRKVEASFNSPEYLMTSYFPDQKSEPCCGGIKNWFSVASIKGELFYVDIKSAGGSITLEKSATVDLTAEGNLALSKLHVRKIVGGEVLVDPSIKRERICASNRQTIYVASYGNTRYYRDGEPSVEIETHGYSCEGEQTVSRFGVKPD